MACAVLVTRLVTLNETKIKIYPCGVTFWYIQTNAWIALRQGLAYSRDSINVCWVIHSSYEQGLWSQIAVVQSLNCVFATPWTTARQSPLSSTISWSLLRFVFIESVMLSNHLNLCSPLLFLPLIFSSIRVFSNESALIIMGPKYWSFSFSISPFSEYSRLISFRMD